MLVPVRFTTKGRLHSLSRRESKSFIVLVAEPVVTFLNS